MLTHLIQWTADAFFTPIQDMGIDHGSRDVRVPEQFLDGADIVAVFQKVGGKRVAEGVAGGAAGDTGLLYGCMNRSLQSLFVAVMTPCLAGTGIDIFISQSQAFHLSRPSLMGGVCRHETRYSGGWYASRSLRCVC
jgi:hypothetical protein